MTAAELPGNPVSGNPRTQEPPAPPDTRACSSCGAQVLPSDGYCEECGADLLVRRSTPPGSATLPCSDCSGTAFTDGYCDHCGRLAPSPRDHWERDLGIVAGVSDRGLRHSRNEDSMAFAVIGEGTEYPASVVVVCDGVSSSVDPQRASQLAANTTLDYLVRALRHGEPAPASTSAAIETAQQAVAGLAEEYRDRADAPSCTIATAVVERGRVTVGWVGDSRVYWLAANGGTSRRLTDDDTWAGQLIAGGAVNEAEAYKAPHAHAILRWLGPEAPPEPPHVRDFAPEGPGLVLACSDGLWNYVWDAADLATLAGEGWDGLAAASASLTAVALNSGGQDNITTVLAYYPPTAPPAAAAAAAAPTLQLPPLTETAEIASTDIASSNGTVPSDEGIEP
ncbi:MAG TPA: PP2C family serine/threonine-protein phosphatase [Actinocrinis sp.]|uniref:PP2C family serine/threonine-protein phosphatase n=1 Tax=Actinocrinis sp. TaxID=1920516 RepID=UPI002D3E0EA5|nr:PP2C family serine/threonine-protein phosphatase [Actinocrinis sp.]HZU54244.1 PP2C family serine/threonine-protein phosphatase [Actinocrinis sp.]